MNKKQTERYFTTFPLTGVCEMQLDNIIKDWKSDWRIAYRESEDNFRLHFLKTSCNISKENGLEIIAKRNLLKVFPNTSFEYYMESEGLLLQLNKVEERLTQIDFEKRVFERDKQGLQAALNI